MSSQFETTSSKSVYKNPWMEVWENTILRRGKPGIYGVVTRQDSVVIVPMSPAGRTVLLRQYRYPTSSDSWELPMGGIDTGETPLAAALRELREETGLEQPELQQIGQFHPVPGLTPQRVTVFLAKLPESAIAEMAPPAEADEIQSAVRCDFTDALAMSADGRITDGFTLSALFMASLHLRQY